MESYHFRREGKGDKYKLRSEIPHRSLFRISYMDNLLCIRFIWVFGGSFGIIYFKGAFFTQKYYKLYVHIVCRVVSFMKVLVSHLIIVDLW